MSDLIAKAESAARYYCRLHAWPSENTERDAWSAYRAGFIYARESAVEERAASQSSVPGGGKDMPHQPPPTSRAQAAPNKSARGSPPRAHCLEHDLAHHDGRVCDTTQTERQPDEQAAPMTPWHLEIARTMAHVWSGYPRSGGRGFFGVSLPFKTEEEKAVANLIVKAVNAWKAPTAYDLAGRIHAILEEAWDDKITFKGAAHQIRKVIDDVPAAAPTATEDAYRRCLEFVKSKLISLTIGTNEPAYVEAMHAVKQALSGAAPADTQLRQEIADLRLGISSAAHDLDDCSCDLEDGKNHDDVRCHVSLFLRDLLNRAGKATRPDPQLTNKGENK